MDVGSGIDSAEGSGVPSSTRHLRGAVRFWRTYRSQKAAVVGLVIVALCVVTAIFAPILSPYEPRMLQPDALAPPSMAHLMGTDVIGRDVLSHIIYGTRIALLFGVGVAGMTLVLGVVLGAIPAYFGGWVDHLFSRFFELMLTIPRLVLTIVLVALLGNSIINVALVVAFTFWPTNAKIVRSQVLSLKERGFVRAARASGAGHLRILWRHVIPNGLYPVITNTVMQMGFAILFEASLSFLGLGDPNYPSWGQLLFSANLRRAAWWLAVFPGLAITVLVMGFNLVGDGLNSAWNPRIQGSSRRSLRESQLG